MSFYEQSINIFLNSKTFLLFLNEAVVSCSKRCTSRINAVSTTWTNHHQKIDITTLHPYHHLCDNGTYYRAIQTSADQSLFFFCAALLLLLL